MTISSNIESIVRLGIQRLDTDEVLILRGREAWGCAQLIVAGSTGVTSLERPASQWSDYIFKLRKRGLPIETVEERHGGAYRGDHGRYFLGCRSRSLSRNTPISRGQRHDPPRLDRYPYSDIGSSGGS